QRQSRLSPTEHLRVPGNMDAGRGIDKAVDGVMTCDVLVDIGVNAAVRPLLRNTAEPRQRKSVLSGIDFHGTGEQPLSRFQYSGFSKRPLGRDGQNVPRKILGNRNGSIRQ